MQPRVWLESLPVDDQGDFVDRALDLFPYVNLFNISPNKYDGLSMVSKLMDLEDTLGIERNDWIYGQGKVFFTTDEMAVLFKLTAV